MNFKNNRPFAIFYLNPISYLVVLIVALSCSTPQKKQAPKTERASLAEFTTISLDTLPAPAQTILKAGKSISTGTPEVRTFKVNTVAFQKTISKVAAPKITIPGKNGFEKPKISALKIHKRPMGKPEVTIATKPKIRDYNPYNLMTYGLHTGLLENITQKTFQDSKGNLWFAAYKGMSKFNGTTNTLYTSKQGIKDDFLMSMAEDKKANLWFLFDYALECFDGTDITNYSFEEEDMDYEKLNDILIDNQGNSWICTFGKGVIKIDKNLTSYTRYGEEHGFVNDINCVSQDVQGNIWFGGEGNGLFKWDGAAFSSYTTKLPHNTVTSIHITSTNQLWLGGGTGVTLFTENQATYYLNLSDSYISSIYEDSHKALWFSSLSSGVFCLKDKQIYTINNKMGLASDEAYHITEDNSGYIWIATVSGVVKYNPMFRNITEADGLSGSHVRSLATDHKQNLWIGSELGGLSYFDRKKNTFTNYYVENGLADKNVFSICEDRDHETWIGYYREGLSKLSADKKSITHYPNTGMFIVSIYEDHRGDIWFSSRDKGGVFQLNKKTGTLRHYTTEQGIIDEEVIQISQDKNLDYVFCTYNGVSILSAEKKIITNYPTTPTQNFGIVESAFQDHTGAYWFGLLADNGLIRLDKTTNKIYTFTTQDGLSNNTIFGITQDKNKNLWVSTRQGLVKVNKNVLDNFGSHIYKNNAPIFKRFTEENGYFDTGDGRHNIELDASGDLWIPKSNSMTKVSLNAEPQESPTLHVEINEVSLFNKKIDWRKDSTAIAGMGSEKVNFNGFEPWTGLPKNFRLGYNNNYLGFRFAAINTSNPSTVKYTYKLEGLASDWSPPATLTDVSFAKIPHGKYAFLVKGISESGRVSKAARFSFEISPPIWQTWYAYTAYALLFATLLYFYVKVRVSQQLKKITEREALRTKISADLHDDVGSILTGLSMQSQMMSLTASEKGKKQLLELSEMSFEAMDRMRDTVWAIDPRRDKFENLVDRMRSFAEKNLPNKNIKHSFVIDIDKPKDFIKPDQRQAVFLIFKEAITNILKHADASHVEVKVSKIKNDFNLFVKDNGTIPPKESKSGQGLGNMIIRAEKIQGNLEMQFDAGFSILLSFRLS